MIRTLLLTGALLGATGCGSSTPSSSAVPSPDASSTTTACAPRAASETELVRANDHGDLHGTLLVPEGCGPTSVALLIAGSGAADRDSTPTNTLKLLAEGLAAHGIASLRFDKAGVAASKRAAPAESELRFQSYAHDAALLVGALREDSRFDRVVVIGHSEGSLLGLVASREVRIDGFVSLAGAGRPIAEVLREQLAQSIKDAKLLATANHIIDELLAGRMVDDVPSSLTALFRPSVQPYLMSWFAIDPAVEMKAFAPSALIVQGTTDLQIKLVDAERLHDAKPDAEMFVVEGMNHTLKTASGNAAAQKKAYTDGTVPLADGLVERIAGFITR